METITILLTAFLMVILSVLSFALGFHFGSKKETKEEEGVHFSKHNKEYLVEMAKWLNYDGK